MSTSAVYAAHTFAAGDTYTAAQANVMDAGIYDTHYANAGAHNSFFRGKSLGTAVSSTQAGYISGATFKDLYIGDYWTIDSTVYRIAAFDYWYNCGNSAALTTHHAVMVPDSAMYSAPMNSTDTTEGAYAGSAMFTGDSITVNGTVYTGLTNAISTLESAFGSYLLTYENYLANAATNGYPSAGAWYSGRVCDLMTEHMIHGAPIRGQMPSGGTSITTTRVGKSQLPIFAINPRLANKRSNYWLADVASTGGFAAVSTSGFAYAGTSSQSLGVCPFFLIS